MVSASLAWSIKAWAALLISVSPRWRLEHLRQQQLVLRMDFRTFANAMINIPAQIIRTGRRIVYRLIGAGPQLHLFFRLLDGIGVPS